MTVTPTYAPVEGNLSVGHIFGSAWDVYAGNFLKFVIIAAAVQLPDLLGRLSVPLIPSAFGPPLPAAGYATPVNVGATVSFLLNMVAQAVVLYIAFQYLRGQPAPLGAAIRKGLGRLFPRFRCALRPSSGL